MFPKPPGHWWEVGEWEKKRSEDIPLSLCPKMHPQQHLSLTHSSNSHMIGLLLFQKASAPKLQNTTFSLCSYSLGVMVLPVFLVPSFLTLLCWVLNIPSLCAVTSFCCKYLKWFLFLPETLTVTKLLSLLHLYNFVREVGQVS